MLPNIILASKSKVRAKLLKQAGVDFSIVEAKIDESQILLSLLEEGAGPNDIVDTLAEYKARRIARKGTEGLVIGSDQILVCEKKIYSKARTMDEAKNKLMELRGKPHQLLSAAVIFEDGEPVWRTIGRAQLFMREFSDEFLAKYLDKTGPDILGTVGCYFLEEDGVSLFNRVQGDYFSVLGFPLLEVLDFLRSRGAILQ